MSDRPRGGLVALCIAELVCWGLLYYSLPVAVTPISEDTGWSQTPVTAALSLGLVVSAPNLLVFFSPWILAGFAQSATLYPPALAVVTRWYGSERVKPLTLLTLVGGLASTVVAPIIAWLIDACGWRPTYVILAIILAVVALPLHL